MEKDSQNCYFCKSKIEKVFSGWTLNPEGWKNMREKHEKEHDHSLLKSKGNFATSGGRNFFTSPNA